MDLGATETEIMNSGYSCVVEAAQQGLLVEGSNQIQTSINGMKVEIRIYIENDVIINFDIFMDWSSRKINNLVHIGGE